VSETTDHIRHALLARVPDGRTLDGDTNFFEAGLTSAALAEVLAELLAAGLPVSLMDMFRYPTLSTLSHAVAARAPQASVAGGPIPPTQGTTGQPPPWER
jgi:aryl carrier-like protein